MASSDVQLLSDFFNHFLGYGALKSSVWLIGPEPGGGNTVDELQKRLTVWDERGRKETEDLQDYHAQLDLPPKDDWSKNIQLTWGCLIRVILALYGDEVPDTKEGRERVREFQIKELGRSNGKNAVLDLSPLSSPSMDKWNIRELGVDWLADRKSYEKQVLPARCELLQTALRNYRPKFAVFYGLSHQKQWEQIAKVRFTHSELDGLLWAYDGARLFGLMRHPNERSFHGAGARNQFFANVGKALRERLNVS